MTRILLIDDDAEVGRLVEHVLVAARYEVEAVGGMSEAVQHLERGRYDLVIADARLPDGTGMHIADIAGEKGVKALIITGYGFSYPELRSYDYLLKPVRPAELIAEVERLLGMKA